jgi:hypothetical protein
MLTMRVNKESEAKLSAQEVVRSSRMEKSLLELHMPLHESEQRCLRSLLPLCSARPLTGIFLLSHRADLAMRGQRNGSFRGSGMLVKRTCCITLRLKSE